MKDITMPSCFDYSTNKKIIEALIKEYPFLRVQIIGRTCLGRGIFALGIGNAGKSKLYVGGVRGDDGASSLLLLKFVGELCQSIKAGREFSSVNMKRALTNSGITLVPCLNPDGRELFLYKEKSAKGLGSFYSSVMSSSFTPWCANAMGVDIALNFLKNKNSTVFSPAPSLYCGEYPESEAETKAITRFCRLKHFTHCLELCKGEGEIIYEDDESAPVEGIMAGKILSSVSPYPLVRDKGEARYNLSAWFIREFTKPAFTLGVREDARELQYTYKELEQLLTVFALF